MDESTSGGTIGGGCLIALFVLLGVIIGLLKSQPTIGFLVGLLIGVAAAIAIWWRDRQRRRR